MICEEGAPGAEDGGPADVHLGGALPEGEVAGVGELAPGVRFAALEGRGGEVLGQAAEEHVPCGVSGLVEGGRVAERCDEEGEGSRHACWGW